MKNQSSAKYEIDMCNGPLLGKILLFYIPLMLSGILQLLFNAADIVVVGRFAGNEALAAVGSTSSLTNLIVNLFIGLSVGANVLVARFYGAGQENELKDMDCCGILRDRRCHFDFCRLFRLRSGPDPDGHSRGCDRSFRVVYADLFCGNAFYDGL